MKKLAVGTQFLAAALLAASLLAQSSVDPAKEADIRRLMEMLGSQEMGEQMGESILQQVRPALENMLPPGERRQEIFMSLEEKLQMQFRSSELAEIVIPIYDRHLKHEEIVELIEFYQSPLGRRILEVMPGIMAEAQEAGSRWGDEIFQQIIAEMEDEFPELKEIP